MTPPDANERLRLRQAFRKPTYLSVRITPQGFDVADSHYDHLQGTVIRASLARKLFRDGFLSCSSSDGVRSEEGTRCDECQHALCQPRLRLHLLAQRALVHVLELPSTSAENYFTLEEQAQRDGADLIDCTVRLSVIDRGHWGEVAFERVAHPTPAP